MDWKKVSRVVFDIQKISNEFSIKIGNFYIERGNEIIVKKDKIIRLDKRFEEEKELYSYFLSVQNNPNYDVYLISDPVEEYKDKEMYIYKVPTQSPPDTPYISISPKDLLPSMKSSDSLASSSSNEDNIREVTLEELNYALKYTKNSDDNNDNNDSTD